MNNDYWFYDLPTLAHFSSEQAKRKLSELYDVEMLKNELTAFNDSQQPSDINWDNIGAPAPPNTFSGWNFLGDKAWQHTAHTVGYIAPTADNNHDVKIQSPSNIVPSQNLQGSRIKITLNALRVASYPGSGTHHILFDFYAQNQLPETTEHLHFNSTYRVREGQRAAILNYPIFLGLNVGNGGLIFKCLTVNVKNEEDEQAIQFLESDAFKTGLQLATTVQPAIKPLSEMAMGLTRSIANRRKNVPVQDIQIGLDFGSNPMGARLAEGVYIAVQIPEALTRVWDWSDWIYDVSTGQIVNDYHRDQLIPYNYIAFGISRYNS